MDDVSELSQRIRRTRGLVRHLTQSLASFFRNRRKRRAVVGLSGGIDSALVCALAVRALGKRNVSAFHFPYCAGSQDLRHAQKAARAQGVRLSVVPIRKMADAFARGARTSDPVALGNFMARSRMALLYHFARAQDALVLGTGNKPEFMMGYFTKFGDGAADYFPLADLYKAQVQGLAGELGIPAPILQKPPSAGLWPGQTDEGEMGISYPHLDAILCGLTDLHWKPSRLERLFGKKAVATVVGRMASQSHKRMLAGRPGPL